MDMKLYHVVTYTRVIETVPVWAETPLEARQVVERELEGLKVEIHVDGIQQEVESATVEQVSLEHMLTNKQKELIVEIMGREGQVVKPTDPQETVEELRQLELVSNGRHYDSEARLTGWAFDIWERHDEAQRKLNSTHTTHQCKGETNE